MRMILWKFKEKPLHPESGASLWCSNYRWVLELCRWFRKHREGINAGISLELNCQLKPDPTKKHYKDRGFKETDWTNGAGYYLISITNHFAFGSKHMYYNGPHCMFSIGFLHFSWQPEDCRKCEGKA